MSKKASPDKSRRVSLKRKRSKDAESEEFDLNSPRRKSQRHRASSPDIDLSDLMGATGYSDPEEDLASLFAEKFKEKSPTSKLSSAFGYVGLKESKLMKKPKLSTVGSRSIGLTAEERARKRRMHRSLDYPMERRESPQRRRRSASRSPHK